MNMKDIIAIAILIVIIGAAVAYIVKAKKNGAKCIGCPSGCNCCSGGEEGSCNCGCGEK